MLASEIRSIFLDVLTEYTKINLISIVDMAIEVLRNKGTGNYVALRSNTIKMIASVEPDLDKRLDSVSVRNFFENSVYPRVLPRTILTRLLLLLPTDESLAGESSEATIVRQQIINATSSFTNFIQIADQFRQDDFVIPAERVLFSIKIRASSINNSFKTFKDKIELYERFFRDCAQYVLSSNDNVEIKHVSMSDLILYFETAKEYFAILMPIWKNILDFAIEIVKTKSLLSKLSGSGVSNDQIDAIKATVENFSLAAMTAGIAKIAESLSKDTNRTVEVKSSFEQTCKMIATDVASGTTLDLHTKADIAVKFLSMLEPDRDPAASQALLVENQQLQEQITALRALEAQPALPSRQ